jgi:hypothetical protein
MNREDIKRNVLSKIDEISPFQETDEQFDRLMESMLDDCANRYLSILPIHLIIPQALPLSVNPPTLNFERGVANYHDLGIVLLPADFLRMAYVNCFEWRKPVNEVKTCASAEYGRQFSFHTKAGLQKPMVFIDTESTQRKRLIISPFRDQWGINLLKIYYIPKTLPEDMQEDLLDGFYWFFASHLLDAMQRYEQGKMAGGKFAEFLVGKQ